MTATKPLFQQSWQQHLEERILLRLQANLRVHITWRHPRKALAVHFDVQRCRRTRRRIDRIRHSDRVEHRRRSLPGRPLPLRCQHLKRVRHRRAHRGQQGPLHLVELQLRCIERHHVDGHAAAKELLRRCRVHGDVVFGVGSVRLRIPKVAVAAIDRTAHHHHPLQLAKACRIAIDRRTDRRQRSQRQQRNLARSLPNLVQQKRHRIPMRPSDPLPCPRCLRKGSSRLGRRPDVNRDIGPARLAHQTIEHLPSQRRIAPRPGEPKNLQLRTDHRQVYREDIVDIVPNIRIDDHLGRRLCGSLCHTSQRRKEQRNRQSVADRSSKHATPLVRNRNR